MGVESPATRPVKRVAVFIVVWNAINNRSGWERMAKFAQKHCHSVSETFAVVTLTLQQKSIFHDSLFRVRFFIDPVKYGFLGQSPLPTYHFL